MKKLTLTDRLRYRFDLTMARGAASLIVWLFALTAVLVTAAAVVEAAKRRGKIAIGYLSGDGDPKARAHVNPKKSGTVTFAAADKIIVLAED
jgi:hypothetical protein